VAINRQARRAVRHRGHQTGAALVEALVAIPFFITIFATTMFVGGFYKEKLVTLRQSKQCAWDNAINGCSGGCTAENSAVGGGELQPPGGTGNATTNGAPGAEIMSQDMYQAKFTVKATATASNLIGGYVRNIQSTTTVMCDEKPADGNPAGVVQYLWNNGAAW
jgi:hypothetical protein